MLNVEKMENVLVYKNNKSIKKMASTSSTKMNFSVMEKRAYCRRDHYGYGLLT